MKVILDICFLFTWQKLISSHLASNHLPLKILISNIQAASNNVRALNFKLSKILKILFLFWNILWRKNTKQVIIILFDPPHSGMKPLSTVSWLLFLRSPSVHIAILLTRKIKHIFRTSFQMLNDHYSDSILILLQQQAYYFYRYSCICNEFLEVRG